MPRRESVPPQGDQQRKAAPSGADRVVCMQARRPSSRRAGFCGGQKPFTHYNTSQLCTRRVRIGNNSTVFYLTPPQQKDPGSHDSMVRECQACEAGHRNALSGQSTLTNRQGTERTCVCIATACNVMCYKKALQERLSLGWRTSK